MRRRILLVRHCQSQANADGRLEGKGDSPLSEAGREQARRVAAFVASQDIGPATLIASPLSRARATADEIAALCGWIPSHDHRIREGELGWMEDMSYDDLRQHMAERQLRVFDSDVHGGESMDAIAERFWEALSEALAATDGPLIAVTHGVAIQALVQRRFGHELGLAEIANGDVIEVWIEGDAVTGPPTRYPLASAGLIARTASRADASAITEIYNQGIEDRIATFETEPRVAADVMPWFDHAHAFVSVVEPSGAVVGYAVAHPYSDRGCYRGIGEYSVYVRRSHRVRGVGQVAMSALIEAARAGGLWKLTSRIFPENCASLSLMARIGFKQIGVHEKHGKLDGVWKDCVIVELLIPENID